MPRSKPPGSGKDFQPGWEGGPGRPPLPPEVRKAKAYNRSYVQIKLTELMEYEVPQLQAILKDPKTKVIDALVASIALHGIKKGDNARMNFLLDRIIGKVKDQVEHTGADGAALELVIKDYRSNSEPNAD